MTQAEVGAALYPRTATEIAASITPTDYSYEPGSIYRYGATGGGTTDDTAAITTLAAYANAVTLSSRPVEIVLPPGVYSYSGGLTFTRPVHISGHGTTLKYTGSAARSSSAQTASRPSTCSCKANTPWTAYDSRAGQMPFTAST